MYTDIKGKKRSKREEKGLCALHCSFACTDFSKGDGQNLELVLVYKLQ